MEACLLILALCSIPVLSTGYIIFIFYIFHLNISFPNCPEAGVAGEVFVSQAQARLSTAGGCNAASTTTTTETTSSTVESGIEETSISAASVIRKFESATSEQQLRASSGSLAMRMNAVGGGEQDAAGVNANLLQETVSSKLKKVSKEEMSSRAETSGEYRFKDKYLYYCTELLLYCVVVSSMD
jgi:hypothetical protein